MQAQDTVPSGFRLKFCRPGTCFLDCEELCTEILQRLINRPKLDIFLALSLVAEYVDATSGNELTPDLPTVVRSAQARKVRSQNVRDRLALNFVGIDKALVAGFSNSFGCNVSCCYALMLSSIHHSEHCQGFGTCSRVCIYV